MLLLDETPREAETPATDDTIRDRIAAQNARNRETLRQRLARPTPPAVAEDTPEA